MAALDRGLYEVLITEALDGQLGRLGEGLEAIRGGLRAPEAGDRIALHLAQSSSGPLPRSMNVYGRRLEFYLARRRIDMIRDMTGAGELAAERPVTPGMLLNSVIAHLPDVRLESIDAPRRRGQPYPRQPHRVCAKWRG